MLIDFIDELRAKMTDKQKFHFLETIEKYPKIKKQLLKQISKRKQSLHNIYYSEL